MREDDNKYWQENIRILKILLSIWFIVSFLMSVIFVDQLDVIRVGGFKFGFWMAQQGSIIGFVLILIIYACLMNRLDHEHGYSEER